MRVLRPLFGPVFILAGLNHFLNPRFYLRIMPPWLPAHDAMNKASGLAEIVGGAAIICPDPRVRRFGGLSWLPFRLPFRGEWRVTQGPDGAHTHQRRDHREVSAAFF